MTVESVNQWAKSKDMWHNKTKGQAILHSGFFNLLALRNFNASGKATPLNISAPTSVRHLVHAQDEREALLFFAKEEALRGETVLQPTPSKLASQAISIPSAVAQLAMLDARQLRAKAEEHSSTVRHRPEAKENTKLVLPRDFRPSMSTVEKAVAARVYFETYFNALLKKTSPREVRHQMLQKSLESCTPEVRQALQTEWKTQETAYLRNLRSRVSPHSFQAIATIGHGAFGIVKLVRQKQTNVIYAMKMLRKSDMLKRGQEGHVRAERDILARARDSTNHIVKLEFSFQDVDHLFLVMEYMPGGDLLQLLIELNTFQEEFARFYIAEMVLCIEETHKLGYIHRDVKPDNFLFARDGHIKIGDFGLATDLNWEHDSTYFEQQRTDLLRRTGIDVESLGDTIDRKSGNRLGRMFNKENEDPMMQSLTLRNRDRRALAYSLVGTNAYMVSFLVLSNSATNEQAPEVIRGEGYGPSCDWWSLGIILFECLYGYAPFNSPSRHDTRMNILNWSKYLYFPKTPEVGTAGRSLIKKLLCERHDRLGKVVQERSSRQPKGDGGVLGSERVQDIKNHPWFESIDFKTLHEQVAPFVPKISDPTDTRYFDVLVKDEVIPTGVANERARDVMLRDKFCGQEVLDTRKQHAFKGYTYRGKRQPLREQVAVPERQKAPRNMQIFESEFSVGRAMSF